MSWPFPVKAFFYFAVGVHLLLHSYALQLSKDASPAAQTPPAGTLQKAPVLMHQEDGERHRETRAGKFQGLLSPDGSISTAKLMNKEDPPSEILPVQKKGRRQITYPRSPQIYKSFNNRSYPPCPEELSDYIPCLNISSGHLFVCACDQKQSFQDCVIKTPADYARQFKWPASKYQVRQPNIPNVPLLRSKKWQPWFQLRGSSIIFQRSEPNFPNGTGEYIDSLSKVQLFPSLNDDAVKNVPGLSFGKRVRVVLEIGSGAGNMAIELEARGAITLSVPGGKSCDDGVQLILERGYPSMLQTFTDYRLPYSNEAFDLIHCAACEVQWELDGGLKLLEADRLLKPGGFFVWVDLEEEKTNSDGMKDLAEKMCWNLVAKEARTSIWEKPTDEACYYHRALQVPTLCGASSRLNNSWILPIQRCIQGFKARDGEEFMQWPNRVASLHTLKLREASEAILERVAEGAYVADFNFWKQNVEIYVAVYGKPRLDDIRNVLDMNAGYGG
ncbi:hypothetical protein R1flu_017323 [Riccia fluitans]|uniref:Methyltransferase n=1 Tax=Riccia fluitans TaxID=41844 RepID=A0ABD1ZCX9_9MARC